MSDIDWPRVLVFLAAAVGVWVVTGALKAAGKLPCDIARKINHVLALAGGAIWFGWLPHPVARASAVAVCGFLIPLIVVVCVMRDRAPFRYAFLANTRKSDLPHEAFYFWSSWLVSMVGLAAVELVFDNLVVTRTATLLVGIGDGVAEPIGRRLGRRRFRVPSLRAGKPAARSLEGSAAFFLGCLLTLFACFGTRPVAVVAGLALLLTVVEAVSPHGLDNLTIPVAAALALAPLLSAGWL
jgi:dolichol kinase